MAFPLSNEVDNDQVEDDVGEHKIGKRTLGAHGLELALVLWVYLGRKSMALRSQYSSSCITYLTDLAITTSLFYN